MHTDDPRDPHPAVDAGWLVAVLTVMLSVGGSIAWLPILRDVLRFRCDLIDDGRSASWTCADGNGYILYALALTMVLGILSAIGLALLGAARRSRAARRAVPLVLGAPALMLLAVAAITPPAPDVELGIGAAIATGLVGAVAASGVIAAALGAGAPATAVLAIAAVAGLGAIVAYPPLFVVGLLALGWALAALLMVRPVRSRTIPARGPAA